jgi:hypothetical protein
MAAATLKLQLIRIYEVLSAIGRQPKAVSCITFCVADLDPELERLLKAERAWHLSVTSDFGAILGTFRKWR